MKKKFLEEANELIPDGLEHTEETYSRVDEILNRMMSSVSLTNKAGGDGATYQTTTANTTTTTSKTARNGREKNRRRSFISASHSPSYKATHSASSANLFLISRETAGDQEIINVTENPLRDVLEGIGQNRRFTRRGRRGGLLQDIPDEGSDISRRGRRGGLLQDIPDVSPDRCSPRRDLRRGTLECALGDVLQDVSDECLDIPRLKHADMNCFYNSAIQLLNASRSFTTVVHVMENDSVGVMSALRDVLDAVNYGNDCIVDTSYDTLCRSHERLEPFGNFSRVDQHDAAEFLCVLFDILVEEAKAECPALGDLLQMRTRGVYLCTKCFKRMRTKRAETSFFLEVPPSETIAFHVARHDYTRPAYDPRAPRARERSHRSPEHPRPPLTCSHNEYHTSNAYYSYNTYYTDAGFFIVRIDRSVFSEAKGCTVRNTAPVAVETLLEFNGEPFRLASLVMHFGSDNSGHYVAAVEKDGEWYCVDDCRIYRVVDKDAFFNENCYVYLALYERLN